MKMTTLLLALGGSLSVAAGAMALAVAFGGPAQPAPMQSISNPFKTVDFSNVPPAQRFAARDGVQLAYRVYPAGANTSTRSVVLIHGSSSRSNSMHPMAKGFAQAGYTAYALDVRGHGESGTRGQIAYIGQLEDDLEDFMKAVKPAGRKTLVGFSSGGGFALRFAGDARQKLFDAYLLLSPFLHQDAATYRPNSGGWTTVGLPRIIGLIILNRLGITTFNDLPVIAFALDAEAQRSLTPQYSFSLAQNFRPRHDYRVNIMAARQPMEVLVGQSDEVFYADRFAAVFGEAGRDVPVTIVPETGHMDLVLKPAAIQATVSASERLATGSN